MLERTRIYATDMDTDVLARARAGAFPLDKLQDYTRNYLARGRQRRRFSRYYAVERRRGGVRPRRCCATSSSPSTTSPPTARSTSST